MKKSTKNNQGYKFIHNRLEVKKRYIGVNLIKESKDHYKENSKTMKEEIEEHTRRWNDLMLSWTSRVNIVKMSILLTEIYMFNTMSIKMLI